MDPLKGRQILIGVLLLNVLLPTAIGYSIDDMFGSFPAMTAVMTLLGASTSSYVLTRAIHARYDQIAPRESREDES